MDYRFIVEKEIELKTLLLEKGFSNRAISKLLLEKKSIKINGEKYYNNFLLKSGDIVEISIVENTTVKPVNKEIEIVYEDKNILVVNKQSELATIPSKAHYEDNLAGRVLYYFNCKGENIGVHVVNRLDYLTCGLVVFAKSNYIHSLFRNVNIKKKYRCYVQGVLDKKEGTIESKIGKGDEGIKREISSNGKNAITMYKVVKEYKDKSLLDVEIKTGRTHQIRVHMGNIGHPLVGDTLYGGESGEFYLCSYYIEFNLPIENGNYKFAI